MSDVHKVAMVTGAGHGIGRAIAQRLASDGTRVLLCDFKPDAAASVQVEIAAAGGTADVAIVDVRERYTVAAAVKQLVGNWGRLDILVANAGIMDRAPFLEFSDELWHRVVDTNLYGAFVCGQLAARQMAAQGDGGRIVNVASNSGVFGGRGRAAYGASKAGIINLTQSMAIELAEHNILVNAVAPGPTLTNPATQGDLMQSAQDRMPLKRYGSPEEIAEVAAFLASDACSFTTGHVFAADGGFTVAGVMEG
jgi:3-oxoacyl-[acyl-carrier protein] reductase